MRFAVVLLAACALSVQGLPKQNVLPAGLKSFQPEHVLAYVKEMASRHAVQSRAATGGNTQAECFSQSSAALNECSEKSVLGNAACDAILTEATARADVQMENDLEGIKSNSDNITSNLKSCGDEESVEDALACFEKQGQSNVSSVSSLSSAARTAKRHHDNTVDTAASDATGCSYEVSAQSEAVSSQIFGNLNACMAPGGVWVPVVVPDFGPITSEPTETTQKTTTPETTTSESTLEPETETTVEAETEN